MFTTIKTYLSLFGGAIVLAFLAYMKYLKSTNEEQKENIKRLKKEIVVRKEVAKDVKKRAVFEAKQKTRYEELIKNEITMDEIEKEIRDNENNPSNGNNFTSSSV